MKRYISYLLLAVALILPTFDASAQLLGKAEEFIHDVFDDNSDKSVATESADTLDLLERYRRDSVRMQQIMLELQDMKLNEIMLRSELDNVRQKSEKADSIKLAEQRRSIDSLRSRTPGVPGIGSGDTLFTLYAD
ncbi:MAG: mechanosensitive ion channel family protein, partial [Muribaculaceae bacterium]|nr:mechanosensitive ion channel family protein [Muribaculaceae bacterium]